MIELKTGAARYFRELIDEQGIDGLGLRITVAKPGTPGAECELSFSEADEAAPDDVRVPQDGFVLYVDAASAPYLEQAEVDFVTDRMGGQLVVRAPNIKGNPPSDEDPLESRVQYLLDTEINPMVAAHGGRVALVGIDEENYVVLQFGGGCHGCGMVGVTLKQGVEKTFLEHLPEIAGVRDATDHATGENPYY